MVKYFVSENSHRKHVLVVLVSVHEKLQIVKHVLTKQIFTTSHSCLNIGNIFLLKKYSKCYSFETIIIFMARESLNDLNENVKFRVFLIKNT